MPNAGIEQPDMLPIDHQIRLRNVDGVFALVVPWYQGYYCTCLFAHLPCPRMIASLRFAAQEDT